MEHLVEQIREKELELWYLCLALKELKGTNRATHLWIASGLTVLSVSTLVIGYGNKLAL